MDLVSMIIPTRNRHRYLPDALKSAFNQRYERLEAIIYNDGSEDQAKTYNLMHDLKNEYGHRFENFILCSKPHRGPNAALNWALPRTQGDYIFVLDDDDILLPYFVSMLVLEFQDRPELGVAYCHGMGMDANGKILKELKSRNIDEYAIYNKSRVPGNAMTRREAFLSAHPMDPNRFTSIKTPRFIDIYEAGWEFFYKDKIGFLYRWHEGNISRIGNKQHEILDCDTAYCEEFWKVAGQKELITSDS